MILCVLAGHLGTGPRPTSSNRPPRQMLRCTPGSSSSKAPGGTVNRTVMDAPSAYAELDMELRDFDLIYAYPWPDEHALYHNILREFGRRGAMFLSYDACEGIELVRLHVH